MVNRSRKEVKRLTRECCEKWSWSIEHAIRGASQRRSLIRCTLRGSPSPELFAVGAPLTPPTVAISWPLCTSSFAVSHC